METFLWFFGITFVAIIIIAIASNAALKKHTEAVIQRFHSLPDFTPQDIFVGNQKEYSIGYDIKQKKICLMSAAFYPNFYSYEDVLQSEVIVDGQIISSQSTGSTLGRAALGGILGGGVGALIGGNSGTRTQNEEVSQIQLKITVNNPADPIYRVNFLGAIMNTKIKRNSLQFKKAFTSAEKWQGTISALIRQSSPISNTQPILSLSTADEIKKLKALYDQGIINEGEFNQGKQKLLI